MKVRVNGDVVDVEDKALVVELLEKLEVVDTRGIALAVNDTVIPKNDWATASLSEDDEVLLITAAQGG